MQPPAPASTIARAARLTREEQSAQIDVKGEVELLGRDLKKAAHLRHTCVRDPDGRRPVVLDDASGSAVDARRVGHVQEIGGWGAACLGCSRGRRFIYIGRNDGETPRGELARDRDSDPRTRTRDDCERPGHALPLLASR